MIDTAPQTARGRVLMHFTMSLDGFVAGPNHEMDWMMAGFSNRPGLVEEYVETTGAILGAELAGTPFPTRRQRTAAPGADRCSFSPTTPKTPPPPTESHS